MKDADISEELAGWAKVDRSIDEAKKQLEQALIEEQFQTVGLLCRETLISLAQIVYDPTLHSSPDGVSPSKTDAKRMLEAYLANELGGRTNEVARRYARAALALANELQHKRTASFCDAALCMLATTAMVNLIALISGRTCRATVPDAQVEFSYSAIDYGPAEHLYQLEVTVINQSLQAINGFKLEFTFPDLDAIPGKWVVLENGRLSTAGQLVEIESRGDIVRVSREGYTIRVTYRSRDVLFPQEELDLGNAIRLRYRVNRSVYANIEDMPPIHWTLYADNMLPKEGEISLNELHN